MNINPLDVLKSAQKVQEQMGEFQGKLETITATGSSGGGMVEIDMNGRLEMLAIRITPEIVDPTDVRMLEDLIMAAFTNGMEKIKESIGSEMGGLLGNAGMESLSSLFKGMQ